MKKRRLLAAFVFALVLFRGFRAGLCEKENAKRVWPAVAADRAACLRDENLPKRLQLLDAGNDTIDRSGIVHAGVGHKHTIQYQVGTILELIVHIFHE